ncbi:hypothetical protein ACHY8Y_002623 [Enterococcus faecalis]|uniref:hypothetical protein n=2 Tax=Enterococcus TaxID=1350 RepID=UPI0003311FE2|nr:MULTISPECIES: hypothetical protein [Enterococcus]EGO8848260.1 hypothetical protein [Enterococcus faecalis]EHE8188902.1 hypothetical protein [Enterococcus faecalis]ELT9180242.1 hypothetical protein [Enterococcus faecalis]EOJ67505.1 hypothetical protein WMY_02741 [Enterococcus faecalis EnGen0337]
MKSVVWIYTINTNGTVIRSSGYAMVWISSKRFQDKLKKELQPEWDLTIISYDIAQDDIPNADIIMYNEVDASYLDEKIKNIGLPLSYIDLQTRKADSIKKNLESFANNKIQNNYYKLLMQKYQ